MFTGKQGNNRAGKEKQFCKTKDAKRSSQKI